jgi:CheY-like chemotaxis protein
MLQLHVLLVEDNDGDILLTTETLEECGCCYQTSVVRDGKDALQFLHQQGKYAAAALPDFVLLDINLPKKNGIEVLQEIRSNPQLRHLPVMMLTTSSSDSDKSRCQAGLADLFITKPLEIGTFREAMLKIGSIRNGAERRPSDFKTYS